MNIDYNAVIEILKSFLENEKTEILGISVGEERQVKDAIRNLLTAYEKQSKEIEELNLKNEKLYEDNLTLAQEIKELKKPKYIIDCKTNEITKLTNDFVSKDKIKAKIEEFKIIRDTILENEKEFKRPMMTYDLKRNDYCEKMLQSLLEKE